MQRDSDEKYRQHSEDERSPNIPCMQQPYLAEKFQRKYQPWSYQKYYSEQE
jgi:hypothetical protein